MKKILTAILCLMMVCMSSVALASTTFTWIGSDTIYLHSWSTPAQSSGTRRHIEWDSGGTNIASNRRALVRIHSGDAAASASWVYDTKSTAYHDYNSGFGNGARDTEIRGRLDNRDGAQAPLIVNGTFFN